MNKEKRRVYHVELDVVDDVEKFLEETKDKSEDIGLMPDYEMLASIKKAIEKSNEMYPVGVYVTNVKVTIPMYGKEEV